MAANIVKEFGVSDVQTGFITAIPYAVGVAAVVIWPLLSDRMQERKWNTALAFLVAAGGLALSTYFPDPVHKMTLLCIETNPTPTRGRGFGAS